MRGKMTLFLCFAVMLSWSGAAKAAEGDMNVLPASESRWRGPAMTCPGPATKIVWTGEDFFVGEYGRPCVFTEDWVKKYGYRGGDYEIKDGRMVFTVGPKAFYFGFGTEFGNRASSGVRFGPLWGKNRKDNYRLRMELSQNVDATDWEFTVNDFFKSVRRSTRFSVKGKGDRVFETDLGYVRDLDGITGFRLTCQTSGATVSVKSVKIAPYSKEVFFRKRFELAEKPIVALATFAAPETYALYVNGEEVDTGTHIYPAGNVKTIDLAPYLKRGENLIAFRKEFYSWVGGNPSWLFEAAAIDREGNIERVLGDASWKCALEASGAWWAPRYDDKSWVAPRLSRGYSGIDVTPIGNGKLAATGVDPAHMGLLQARPFGRQYPLFDFDEEVRFELKIPAGAATRLVPELTVREAETGAAVETVGDVSAGGESGGFVAYVFPIKTRKVGPYKLEWTLRGKDGKIAETRSDELIIVGPIAQDAFSLAEFEQAFEKRLRPVKNIDCAATPPGEAEFLDHSGMYNPTKRDKGGVTEADGFRYRETGAGRWDYFAYRVNLEKRGAPYLVEIIIPDNRNRYVYSGIVENYPIAFSNNYENGSRGWFKCSGTAITGVTKPLSFREKKLRYVYWPGRSSAAVIVMSGMRDYPAAASAINVYAIDGGLPALKIAETDRMFGSHNERLSTLIASCGAAESPLLDDCRYRLNGIRDGWRMWYRAIERKIRLLRFRGMNMTVEGAYMYSQAEYPSTEHSPNVSNRELDGLLLAVKMYHRNNIKCMLGFEYVASPRVAVSGVDKTSDRKLRAGERGIRHVDRHGRQIGSSMGGGGNFLQPDSEKAMLDAVREIYARYNAAGEVAGLFWVIGEWWAPGFIRGTFYDIESTEVGYDDLTCELFEKETDMKLDVSPKDPLRFQKRYDKLMSDDYRSLWFYWRALKVRQFFEKARGVVGQGKRHWPIYVFPTVAFGRENPFDSLTGTRDERDAYAAKRLADSGLSAEMYPGDDGIHLVAPLNAFSKFDAPSASYQRIYGWNKSASALNAIEKFQAAYWCSANGLDEVDCPAAGAAKWPWSHTTRGVFIPRWIGDNCMADFVEIIARVVPKTIFDSWLDCNLDTAFGEQLRRFAESFYVTPELKFKDMPRDKVKGVIARTAVAGPVTYLRLANASPYPLIGFIRASADSARDLVYGRELPSRLFSDKYALSLSPYDIRTVALRGLNGNVECDFEMPADIAAELAAKARFVLNDASLSRKIPGDLVAAMVTGLEKKDAFALYDVMSDYEVNANLVGAEKNYRAMKNQTAFLEDLEKSGRGRIICASETSYKDPRGDVWWPDQKYAAAGAYGNEGANFADRGDIEIHNTDIDRVYQTEAYGGHVLYHVPVPNGRYNVYLHFAETYAPIQSRGVRLFTVKVEQVLHPKKIDPFAMGGGFCRPYILEFKDLFARDGTIDIEMSGGVGIAGIEVEKVKK